MLINVRVIPNAKANKIIEESDRLKIYLTAQPQKGKANKALIDLLASHFDVRKSAIHIIKGETSREKTIDIKQ